MIIPRVGYHSNILPKNKLEHGTIRLNVPNTYSLCTNKNI